MTTKFQSLYESLLLEMPHISFEVGGNHYDFDFELEKHQKDWFGLVRLMHNILASKSVKDKYGNVLRLETKEQKHRLVEELRNNQTFNLFLKRFYNKSFDDLLDLSHQTPKIEIAHKNNTSPNNASLMRGLTTNVNNNDGMGLPTGSSGGAV
jgi:hypothetical protein